MSAGTLVKLAQAQGLTITTAESCTGGLLAGAITDIAGASNVFERGVVTYSNAAKGDLLDVSDQTLADYGAVSEQVAAEMAQGALATAGADLALSVTGIAGPGGSEHKPEGRVCFGLARPGVVHTETIEFGPLGRSAVRSRSVEHALRMAVQALTLSRA